MELIDEIRDNWDIDLPGQAQNIASLHDAGFPAWTVAIAGSDSYGVAIPYDGDEDINEVFSKVRIASRYIQLRGVNYQVLELTCTDKSIKTSFSELCYSLINPGDDGINRKKVTSNPLEWWKNWKEMLGNRVVDDRVYDMIGELCVLKEMLKTGENISWNGPDSSSYDIEMDSQYVEVKSTTLRDKKEVQISSQFQLQTTDKPLWLVYCQFERMTIYGITIDSLVEELVKMGMDRDELNDKLNKRGFEIGMSSLRQPYFIHNMIKSIVDDSFPRITPESFVNGDYPKGITKITYTVDLSGLDSQSII